MGRQGVYTHSRAVVYKHTHIKCIHTYILTYIHTYIHTYTRCTCASIYKYTCSNIYIHELWFINIHTNYYVHIRKNMLHAYAVPVTRGQNRSRVARLAEQPRVSRRHPRPRPRPRPRSLGSEHRQQGHAAVAWLKSRENHRLKAREIVVLEARGNRRLEGGLGQARWRRARPPACQGCAPVSPGLCHAFK